ncbi:unnamed protein product [Calypogeia fissa]
MAMADGEAWMIMDEGNEWELGSMGQAAMVNGEAGMVNESGDDCTWRGRRLIGDYGDGRDEDCSVEGRALFV